MSSKRWIEWDSVNLQNFPSSSFYELSEVETEIKNKKKVYRIEERRYGT
jgi:hypothetical protein